MEQIESTPKVLNHRKSTISKKKWLGNFIANTFLLAFGLATSISGLVIQLYYHLGGNSRKSNVAFLDHTEWNLVHVWFSMGFIFIVIYHIWAHRKWYNNFCKQKLLVKSRPTMILTYLMLISTISGLIPLFISFFDVSNPFRHHFIEIHDKVAIIFLIIVIAHTMKRFKYYLNVIKNKF